MKQIVPYLFFDGKCKEAMEFYHGILGGDLSIQTVGESPMAENMPDSKDRVLHAAIMIDGNLMLMASDTMMPEQKADMGGGVSNTIICDSKEEIETFFAKLSDGGNVDTPLEDAFFGTIGNLTDKFGVRWMLEYDAPKA